MRSPFDFLNTINDSKTDLMDDSDGSEKGYVPYVINRTLSYFPDTVMFANEMNIHHALDPKLQYHFLLHIVRRRKRFSKWVKPDQVSDLDVVKQHYGYSNEKARQVLPLLTSEQMEALRVRIDRGGRR